ncbi:MAG: AAA family ATPase [Pseudomonadota bacterium]
MPTTRNDTILEGTALDEPAAGGRSTDSDLLPILRSPTRPRRRDHRTSTYIPSTPPTAHLSHVVGDQSAVLRFMKDPLSHGLPEDNGVEHVMQIDTHGAVIFLAGDKAYKIKRAVCFPFMDFSTLARREEACRAEIEINRPCAPDIYIDTVAITRDKTGELGLNGRGVPIEWAVEMHRFDTNATFDSLAEMGDLTAQDLDAAVDTILQFQKRAPIRRADDWITDLESYIDQNDKAFHETHGIFNLTRTTDLTDRTHDEWQRMRPLLAARGEAGRVRRCHGDLHLRNLVRTKDGVRIFDAIEFDERIATGDLLYDLAFLLMDLDERSMRTEANRVLNRALALKSDESDYEALAALPLFLSIRAALRAKISAMTAHHLKGADKAAMIAEAKVFFRYAGDVLEPRDVSLTVVGGLSGTGKSSVAQGLAPVLGRTPGAAIIRSDAVRKAMLGASWSDPLDASAYTADVTEAVFEQLRVLARHALSSGHSVIIDAVCARAEEREAFESVARGVECHFAGVWLDAALNTRIERIADRVGDPSDADANVARLQEDYDVSDVAWPRVDSGAPLLDVLKAVRPLVDRLN